ncbi:hypothetical protein PL78_18355 [Yersinia entomophaga]|uniref:Uncharacterized protein n=1 Tax=Yersinia entomophaga TaxID=935293 RepID=A0ABN4Q0Q4_YERET|nr:hypothetical protein PL78_18355 [Yersinia entomophaga]
MAANMIIHNIPQERVTPCGIRRARHIVEIFVSKAFFMIKASAMPQQNLYTRKISALYFEE